VRDVDESLVELGSLKLKLFADSALLCDQFINWLARVEDHTERSSSFEMMVESFLSGVFGNPLGPYKEMKIERKDLDARQQELVDQARQLEVRNNDFFSRMYGIRAELARRYSREFPIAPKK
jgi:hypothetical protein